MEVRGGVDRLLIEGHYSGHIWRISESIFDLNGDWLFPVCCPGYRMNGPYARLGLGAGYSNGGSKGPKSGM